MDVPDPYTQGGFSISDGACVPFDHDAGESVALETVVQGTTMGGTLTDTELPLGNIDDSSLEGM